MPLSENATQAITEYRELRSALGVPAEGIPLPLPRSWHLPPLTPEAEQDRPRQTPEATPAGTPSGA
jgi:hypothetical protein